MAIQFQIRDGLAEVSFHGDVTTTDLRQLLETYKDLESRLETTPDRVADLSAAQTLNFETSHLREFALVREAARLKNRVKSAIIAPSLEQFGLARMFQAYNQNPAIEIMIFKDAPSAYAWLGRVPKPGATPNV